MRNEIDRFLSGFIEAKREAFGGNDFGKFVRNDIPKAIIDTGLVNNKEYIVSGSVGTGNWAMIPWVGIFYKKITTSATKGVYIAYLLSKDGKRLYLTFNQGCTDISERHTRKETIEIIRSKAREIRKRIAPRNFIAEENIDLGDNLKGLGEFYQKGTIFYKEYIQGQVPAEEELQEDLSKMMDIYKEYIKIIPEMPPTVPGTEISGGGDREVLENENINTIKQYISQKGFMCADDLIESFYLSLKTKPFVILAGISGTGKSWITRLFAEAIGAGDNYEMISVRPDWSDASELLGYVNLDGNFIPGMLTSILLKASKPENKDNIYFVCLDEMNLARVEYYFSDFLSVIETRMMAGDRIVTSKIFKENSFGPDKNGEYKKTYGNLIIPDNVYIVGTVNMDETTYPFSKKVLDRANTIEISEIDLRADMNNNTDTSGSEKPSVFAAKNDFIRSKYLDFKSCYLQYPDEMNQMVDMLESINKALKPINAQIAYRVRNEIAYYISYSIEEHVLPFEQAMDNAIMQKILPRIQGEGYRIQKVFAGILDVIIPGKNFLNEEDLLNTIEEFIKSQGSDYQYRKTIKKIQFMLEGIRSNGYAAYWL